MTRTARLLALSALLAGACRSTGPGGPPTASTADLLTRIARRIGPDTPFVGEPAVVDALSRYRSDRTPATFERRLRLANALLRVGRVEESCALFDELLPEAKTRGLPPDARIDRVALPRAVAYLTLGERENCIQHHTGDSCLFPIKGSGVHGRPRGSLAAVTAFESILEERPDDLVAKWLLNVASMTLGRGPETIRPEWRIDPSAYAPKSAFPPFRDVAGLLGLAVNGLAGGVVVDDFDGDGYLDVMVSQANPIDSDEGQLHLFKNRGDGTFQDVTREAGLDGIRGGLNLVQGDFDNNGYPDVLVLRGAWQAEWGEWPSTLLANDHGHFTDVTAKAGILRFEPTQAAAVADYDGDGFLDVFIGVESGFPRNILGTGRLWASLLQAAYRLAHPRVPGHLWHNRGDGTFEDVLPSLHVDVSGWIKGAAWADYDGDGRPDLYISRYGETNILLHNDGPDARGKVRFTDVTQKAGVAEPIWSFPVWFFDYDNDGRPDLFVGGYPRARVTLPKRGLPMELATSPRDEIAGFVGMESANPEGKPRLYRNRGDGTFEDVTKEAGLWRSMSVMGANFGDLDGDGFLDMYLGTGTPPLGFLVPNRAFRNVGGTRFEDVTVAANLGSLAKGHAVAFADLDGDGDQDVVEVLGGAFPGDVFPNAVFENPGFGNDWIALKLEGVRANRSAIGARICVTLPGGRRIYRTVGSGGSFGASPLEQQIGLGKLADGRIEEIEIVWPDRERSVQRLGPLAPGTAYRVRQGEAPVVIPRRSACFPAR